MAVSTLAFLKLSVKRPWQPPEDSDEAEMRTLTQISAGLHVHVQHSHR